ncbi:response regulator [Gorillibacterium sp. sgz5001074]|uniref:response regulator n=1 Tax=Gorillibacterium sp. sgz5001074 TaxID=3446695 RepID=UPI003F6665B8
MKKVVLVDDEIVFRETIRECLDWDKEGLIYCGDASDGEVALPILEQVRPDILITDISMPFMNGLELCNIVTKRFPEMKIIILSGHGEFEYARSALRLGIDEYCLKPISSAELTQTLREVSAKIDQEREEKSRIEKLERRESEHVQLSRQKLLNDLCSGFVTTHDAIQLSTGLHLNLVASFYTVVIADYRSGSSALQSKEAAGGLAERLSAMQREPSQLSFQRSKSETVWILKADSLEQLQKELQPFKDMQLLRMEDGDPTLAVGIGSVQDRLQNVHISFLEAAEDMHWRRLSRQNSHSLWEIMSGTLDASVFLDRGRFIQFLKIGTMNQLDSFIPEYAAVLKDINWKNSPIGYYILNDLTLEVFRSAKNMYRRLSDSEEVLGQLQLVIGSIRAWEDVCAYLRRLTEQFWSWRSRIDKYSDMLLKVKEFIRTHYHQDDVSLQDAADHAGVSPSHLSKVFSQETGQTFIEYVTQVRIRKAMELLQTTSAKSYEIAFQVGYCDPHYFSNLFKRMTGMTTKEFRKSGLPLESLAEEGA